MTNQSNINDHLLSFFTNKSQIIYADMEGWQVEEFQENILSFLRCKTYPEAEAAAARLNNYILCLHGKLQALRKVFDDLDRVEKELNSDYQRLHFVHQAHVFLIGLYLYGTFPQVQKAINQEMLDTAGGCLSGGNETGEFLFRWRMASLVHDLGYSLALIADNSHLHTQLQGFKRIIGRPIARPEELYRYDDKHLLFQVSDRVKKLFGFSLRSIVQGLSRVHPYADTGKMPPFYDHGILSAVMFLYLMNYEYGLKHENSLEILGYELNWNPENLDHSILEIAMAVALHNLDQKNYEKSFSLFKSRYYAAKPSPFAWLLKTCDMLQEWDKPKTSEHARREGPLDSLFIDFLAGEGVLEVRHFPPKDDVRQVLEGYSDAPIKIIIRTELP